MADKEIALMAHLLRRAGFGGPREQLEAYCAKGYEATVEELIHPESQPGIEEDLMFRYLPDYLWPEGTDSNKQAWVYRMINTKHPLEEKMALFWHGVLCSGAAKINHSFMMTLQVDMFRRYGLGSFRDLLVELSKTPAMIYFLDNSENHKSSINENYGRELLELFSMGVGMDGHPNYTEDDVKACAHAFTGWNIAAVPPHYPYSRTLWQFLYNPTDHDDGLKTFLGETGRWNGEDVIDILMHQPATSRFIARHLYNFFVADEPQVPAWQETPPQDLEAIQTLEKAFVESNYEIRPMLRVLFNSDFFKQARFTKVKSPAEVVAGTMRLVQDHTEVKPGLLAITFECLYMGQDLLNPPTVEGWHTGKDWIDSGTLVERINFVSDQVGNTNLPGVRSIIERLASRGTLTPEQFVDGCLDLMGCVEVTEKTRDELIAHASWAKEMRGDTEQQRNRFASQVGEMLQLIAATGEYQLG